MTLNQMLRLGSGQVSRRAFLRFAVATGAALPFTQPVSRLLAALPANPPADLDLALTLGGFCAEAYVQLDKPSAFRIPAGYTLVAPFTGRDQQNITAPYGFIAESAASVVIAFRGTQTTTEWITDADFSYTRFPFVADAGSTHAGFTGIYASARGEIMTALRKVGSGKRLYVTGHSLGAALATLHALDAAVNVRPPSLVMYNFASPRVGDRRFAARYDQAIGTSIRFVNAEDIVPKLPTSTTGYTHVKAPLTFAVQTGSRGGNHSLVTYIAAVQKARQQR